MHYADDLYANIAIVTTQVIEKDNSSIKNNAG